MPKCGQLHPLPIRDQVHVSIRAYQMDLPPPVYSYQEVVIQKLKTQSMKSKKSKTSASQSASRSIECPCPTTFGQALESEPLANACIAALDRIGMPGVGLKLLRLVSKQANRSLVRAISGYTLLIDGRQPKLPPMSLLKQTQLSYLRVVVDAGEGMDAQSWNLGWSWLSCCKMQQQHPKEHRITCKKKSYCGLPWALLYLAKPGMITCRILIGHKFSHSICALFISPSIDWPAIFGWSVTYSVSLIRGWNRDYKDLSQDTWQFIHQMSDFHSTGFVSSRFDKQFRHTGPFKGPEWQHVSRFSKVSFFPEFSNFPQVFKVWKQIWSSSRETVIPDAQKSTFKNTGVHSESFVCAEIGHVWVPRDQCHGL